MGRGQSDVQKLLAFIIGITVLLAVLPAAFGVAGVDIRDASLRDDRTTAESERPDGGLLVLSSYGSAINDDRTSVGTVELLVTPATESVNVSDVTVTWDGSDRYTLAPPQVGAGDASFGVDPLEGGAELQPGERLVLQFDRGTDDLDGVQYFGDRLTPGETVTLTITTGTGAETTTTVRVPDPLPPGVAVRL
ncbi:hypothetical protein SAMN05216226_101327 [Halovenus aranensis]|uniref:Uncharacterized protein n=1 Tax=Halovenus aranensis TaxID=890420 RepID=A0A1G8S7J7_9EURY|nr:hypothetical protein [Halovenus aranensis]SDJ25156.1 hypothetical protein SAMN05216226_101327 [Halovenus aranensis]